MTHTESAKSAILGYQVLSIREVIVISSRDRHFASIDAIIFTGIMHVYTCECI